MANLFCSECGDKCSYTLKKPKFCQSCGEPFSAGVSTATAEDRPETGEEGVPFLSKIDCAIEGLEKTKATFAELCSNPINPEELQPAKEVKNYQSKDKKSYESESMKECGRVTESKEI